MEAAHFSILFRQQDGRGGTIVLRNDEELHAGLGAVGREKPITLGQTGLVLLPVGLANLAPVAAVMARERGLDFGVGHLCEHTRRDDNAPERELLRRWLRTGLVGGEMNHAWCSMFAWAARAGGGMDFRNRYQTRQIPQAA